MARWRWMRRTLRAPPRAPSNSPPPPAAPAQTAYMSASALCAGWVLLIVLNLAWIVGEDGGASALL